MAALRELVGLPRIELDEAQISQMDRFLDHVCTAVDMPWPAY